MIIILFFIVTKVSAQPPNTTEDSSQNSDMGDTKSLSPPTSISEMSADTEPRTDVDVPIKMDVEEDTKNGIETSEERLGDTSQELSVSFYKF